MTNQTAFIDAKAWQTSFSGWEIVDCAVRAQGFVYVLLRETMRPSDASSLADYEIPSRLVVLYTQRTDPDEQCGHIQLSGFLRTFAGVATTPIAQGFAISMNGDVYAMGSGQSGMEAVAPGVTNLALTKSRAIDGRLYVVGLARDVYRRLDVGRWEPVRHGLPALSADAMSPYSLIDMGFKDIDGFSEGDIYAVGGKGDVWHYDGQRWTGRKFPTHEQLHTVCCAADGWVYITVENGSVYRGKADEWECVSRQNKSIPYNDSVWFAGKLWLASDYGLDWPLDGRVEAVEHAGERLQACGHLDARDGLLVVAGYDRVLQYDGEKWLVLVKPVKGND